MMKIVDINDAVYQVIVDEEKLMSDIMDMEADVEIHFDEATGQYLIGMSGWVYGYCTDEVAHSSLGDATFTFIMEYVPDRKKWAVRDFELLQNSLGK